MKRRNLPIDGKTIAERAAAIRATWTPEEREKRRVCKHVFCPLTVMRVSTADLNSTAFRELVDELNSWEYLEDYEVWQHERKLRERHQHKEYLSEDEAPVDGDALIEYVEAIVVDFGE